MAKQSAGILLYRNVSAGYEVFIVHPGGPFWAKKDSGAWSIPKGEFVEGEEPLAAAKREFTEETGQHAPAGAYEPLGQAKQPSGKIVYIWAIQANMDPAALHSNAVELEWPPRSGQRQSFPEVDRAGWFGLAKAKTKLVKGQVVFVERLAEHLGVAPGESQEPTQAALF